MYTYRRVDPVKYGKIIRDNIFVKIQSIFEAIQVGERGKFQTLRT